MNTFSSSQVPPGFRFHPTDEELVDYYLRKKVASRRIELDVIKDVDLYKIEPWDIQEICRLGTEDVNEWYFFSHKDKKYPTGTRTNRATASGFWKATGRDKAIYSKRNLIGMRKTLVFYQGRAPNGQKSDWIMHEYRLESDENGITPEEGWVVCRVFKKRVPTTMNNARNNSWLLYDDQTASYSMQMDLESPKVNYANFHLPLLESPRVVTETSSFGNNLYGQETNFHALPLARPQECDNVMDWRILDRFVASQLSPEDVVPNERDDSQISRLDNNNNNMNQKMSEEMIAEESCGYNMDQWE